VPDSVYSAGLLISFVFMTSEPFRTPLVEGVKTTFTVQFCSDGTPPRQLSVSVKSPLATMLPNVSVALLLLVIVNGRGGLDVPTGCEPKVRLAGVNATPVPVAENLTVCGLATSLLEITRLPKKYGDAVSAVCGEGENFTLKTQLVPAASELPQLLV
jgi:hypothetical protein